MFAVLRILINTKRGITGCQTRGVYWLFTSYVKDKGSPIN